MGIVIDYPLALRSPGISLFEPLLTELGFQQMPFPRAFVLIRDYGEAYFCDFEEFREHIAEVTFFDKEDKTEENRERLIVDAWNFLSLQEEEEARRCEELED